MEYFVLLLFILILLCIIALLLHRPKQTPKKPEPKPDRRKPIPKIPMQKPTQEYDSEGYNRQGYNNVGKNRQGKYNRIYNVKCYKTGLYSEEGFLDIRKNPIYLTNHARKRMYERMNVKELSKMKALARDAYQYGKSKMQLMKSEREIIEEKEHKYDNSVILIYRGYCYVFTEDNGLITVYKNDIVRA